MAPLAQGSIRKLARSSLILLLLAVALLVAGRTSAVAEPKQVPTCGGQDMLPEMEAKDPGVRQRIDAAASRIANGNAVLWRVSRDGVKPSYLFGTIHLSDERVTNLPPMVVAKLEAAKRVALEVADVSPQAFMSALGQIQDRLVFKDGRNLTTLLDPADLATAQSALATVGFPATVRPQLRPWFVTMMLAVTSCERKRLQAGRQPLDLKIGEMARRRGVPVLGLETIRDQLLVTASIPEADQIKVLQATLKSYARMGDALEAMLQRYLAREMHKVLPMQAEMLRAQGFDPASMNSFQHALLTVRNPRMRDAALPILAEGEAFIAVGALHLIGETGLVALLRQSGYELTPAD